MWRAHHASPSYRTCCHRSSNPCNAQSRDRADLDAQSLARVGSLWTQALCSYGPHRRVRRPHRTAPAVVLQQVRPGGVEMLRDTLRAQLRPHAQLQPSVCRLHAPPVLPELPVGTAARLAGKQTAYRARESCKGFEAHRCESWQRVLPEHPPLVEAIFQSPSESNSSRSSMTKLGIPDSMRYATLRSARR